jgi:hypothetical protein
MEAFANRFNRVIICQRGHLSITIAERAKVKDQVRKNIDLLVEISMSKRQVTRKLQTHL